MTAPVGVEVRSLGPRQGPPRPAKACLPSPAIHVAEEGWDGMDEVKAINRKRRDEMKDVRWAETVVAACQTCLQFYVPYSTALPRHQTRPERQSFIQHIRCVCMLMCSPYRTLSHQTRPTAFKPARVSPRPVRTMVPYGATTRDNAPKSAVAPIVHYSDIVAKCSAMAGTDWLRHDEARDLL